MIRRPDGCGGLSLERRRRRRGGRGFGCMGFLGRWLLEFWVMRLSRILRRFHFRLNWSVILRAAGWNSGD